MNLIPQASGGHQRSVRTGLERHRIEHSDRNVHTGFEESCSESESSVKADEHLG